MMHPLWHPQPAQMSHVVRLLRFVRLHLQAINACPTYPSPSSSSHLSAALCTIVQLAEAMLLGTHRELLYMAWAVEGEAGWALVERGDSKWTLNFAGSCNCR